MALTSVVVGLPVAVALGVLRHPRWYPLLDLVQTELRVRDVGTRHTPLIGLPGRFNALGQQGSHLGPLSFWTLRPFYTLFGSSAWALQVAAACLNAAATGIAIWIGHRRGGVRLALAVAAGLAVLVRFYGADKLTEAWNPYMPMLWWVVFLLAVWSVLCDDLAMLPVAVFAGSFCVQTHIPYLGLVGGVGGLLVLGAAGGWLMLRRAGGVDPDLRRRVLRWGGGSLALLVVLWIPPVVEQFTNSPSNLSVLRESLMHPEAERVGSGEAVSVWLGSLNVGELVVPPETGVDPGDTVWPGLILLAVWLAAAGGVVWRYRRGAGAHDPRLLLLHAVVAAALLFGLASITRITGLLWYYLVLWSWGTTLLLLIAAAWTVFSFWPLLSGPSANSASRSASGSTARRAERGSQRPSARPEALLAGVVIVVTAAFTYDAAHTEVPAAVQSETLAAVAPPTVEALGSGDLPGGGVDGRYLVLWDDDAMGIGSQGYGMLLELERQGFDVGASPAHEVGVTEHRVLAPEDATAAVHYVVGDELIEEWQTTSEAIPVAEADPRTPEERERFEELYDEVAAGLEAAGQTELEPLLDRALFLLAVHDDLAPELVAAVEEMMAMGLPAAVFLTPPLVNQPTAG